MIFPGFLSEEINFLSYSPSRMMVLKRKKENLQGTPQGVENCNKETFKGTVSRDFLLQVFFHESPSTKPLIITLGSFRIFSKIRGDLPPVSTTLAANFATNSPCVVDTGGN
jgi:hypothetical protein